MANALLKRTICICSALLTALCLCACTGTGRPSSTEAPAATDVPEVDYELTHEIRYWPEDADFGSCDYACNIEKPVFSRSYTAGAAMNAEVERYIEELYSDIERLYMPSAVAEPPYTEVSCEVKPYEGYTQIVFTEVHAYEAQPYTETYVLILDERGGEVGINDIFRTYHADTLIAAALPEAIMAQVKDGYEGLEPSALLPYIDPIHGCYADENGCTVFIPEGIAAPYEAGEVSASLPKAALLPDFAGEAVTEEEFFQIARMTDLVCSAAIVRGDNIESGRLTAYEATAFMGGAVQGMGLAPQKGRLTVEKKKFLSFYKECFRRDFPGLDADAFDIKQEDDGSYSVSATQRLYEYHLDILSAEWKGGVLMLTADMLFGEYGSAYSVPVCHVTVRLTKNEASPYGFAVKDFIMNL